MNANYVDSEVAVANWAKAHAGISSAVKSNGSWRSIFIGGVPKISNDSNNQKLLGSLPMMVLYRAGGSPEPTIDTAIDNARISFSCYGGNRASAFNLTKALKDAAMSITGGTVMDSSATCGGATVLSEVWLPDPVLDLPCFRVDVRFTLYATTSG